MVDVSDMPDVAVETGRTEGRLDELHSRGYGCGVELLPRADQLTAAVESRLSANCYRHIRFRTQGWTIRAIVPRCRYRSKLVGRSLLNAF